MSVKLTDYINYFIFVGLVNCIRKEPECQHVRGLFIVGKAPKFDCSSPFYQRQLDKNLDVNVLMNGSWGTYRHLLLGTVLIHI